MRQARRQRMWFGTVFVMTAASLAVVAAGCGMEPGGEAASDDGLEVKQGALNVTW